MALLAFDCGQIEELPGENILAGLDVVNRKTLVNEKHLARLRSNLGLYRNTISYEAGHYDLGIDRAALLQPFLPGIGLKPRVAHRHAAKANRAIAILMGRAATGPKAAKLLKQITQNQDTPEQKSAVDRYQSALLMPEWLMREIAADLDLTSWPVLYQLAETAEVTISNLHSAHSVTTDLHSPGQQSYLPEPG